MSIQYPQIQNRGLCVCNFEQYHVPVTYLHEISNLARLDLYVQTKVKYEYS